MQSQTTQIRVTLPVELQGYLQAKASKFGLTLATYIKHLIIDDVKDVKYPVMKASRDTEQSYERAMRERDRAAEITDLDDYFNKL
jgi:predicted DNA-binding protein